MNVRISCLRGMAACLLPALVLAGTPTLNAADEKSEAKPAAKAAATEESIKPAERRGPLPFYYGKVVSPDQKGSW